MIEIFFSNSLTFGKLKFDSCPFLRHKSQTCMTCYTADQLLSLTTLHGYRYVFDTIFVVLHLSTATAKLLFQTIGNKNFCWQPFFIGKLVLNWLAPGFIWTAAWSLKPTDTIIRICCHYYQFVVGLIFYLNILSFFISKILLCCVATCWLTWPLFGLSLLLFWTELISALCPRNINFGIWRIFWVF